MKRPAVVTATTGLLLFLVACSPQPRPEQVADRFLIELEGLTGLDTSTGQFDELADSIADALAEGNCGAPAYFTGLQDSDLQDAVLLTCSMYYDSELTDSQRDEVRAVIIREATEGE